MNSWTKLLIQEGLTAAITELLWEDVDSNWRLHSDTDYATVQQAQRLVPLLWRHCGYPVVRLSLDTIESLIATDLPDAESSLSPPWQTFVIEVGDQGAILVADPTVISLGHRSPNVPLDLVEAVDRALGCRLVYAVGQDLSSLFDHLNRDTIDKLLAHVGFILAHRPEGLDVHEHRPSAKAKRKQRIKHYSKLEYVIQPTRSAFTRSTPHAGTRTGSPLQVRTQVRGHYRQQPHGPGKLSRRKQWIAPFWKGPEDGPISIHPLRLNSFESAA